MVKDVALRQYVFGLHQIDPTLSIKDIVNDVRNKKQYSKSKRNSIYQFVKRTIKRGSIQDKKRKKKRTKTTKENVKKIQKILKSKRIDISRGSIHHALRNDIKATFSRLTKTQTMTQEHKTRRVACETFDLYFKDSLGGKYDDWIFQDDKDSKHGTQHAKDAVASIFTQRLDPNHIAPKMADMWPIENVWAIIHNDLDIKEFENVKQLKRAINISWRKIDSKLCERMISSIPRRLKAIIKKEGNQITKEDYVNPT